MGAYIHACVEFASSFLIALFFRRGSWLIQRSEIRLYVWSSACSTCAMTSHRSDLSTNYPGHEGTMPRCTRASSSRLAIRGTVCHVRLDGMPPFSIQSWTGRDDTSFRRQRRSGRADDLGRVDGKGVDTARVAPDAVPHLGGTREDDAQLTSSSTTFG